MGANEESNVGEEREKTWDLERDVGWDILGFKEIGVTCEREKKKKFVRKKLS